MKLTDFGYAAVGAAVAPFACGLGWTTQAQGAVPAVALGAAVSSVVVTSCAAPADWEEDVECLHETLFPGQFVLADFELALDLPVHAEGVFGGENWAGAPFTLEVVVADPVDLSTIPGVTAQDLADAAAVGLEVSSIVAAASTTSGQAGVLGMTASWSDTDGDHSKFIFLGSEDLSGPIFVPAPAPKKFVPKKMTVAEVQQWVQSEQPKNAYASAQTLVVQQKASNDCDECHDDYNDAVDAANQAYDDAVDAANDAYDAAAAAADAAQAAAVAACQATYQAAVDGAGITLAAQLTLCHTTLIGGMAACATAGSFFGILTGGVALAVCIIAVHATYAACTALAIDAYNGAKAAAAAARAACVGAANAAHQAAINAAEIARLQAIMAAAQAKAAALQAALADLMHCLANCGKNGGNAQYTGQLVDETMESLVLTALN